MPDTSSNSLCGRLGRMKGLLWVMAAAYLAPILVAALLVTTDVPGFRELRIRAQAAVLQAGPIPAIAQFLAQGRLLVAIALTFAWNFGVAACLGSVAIGVLFPLPPLVAVLRGFLIGLVFADRLRITWILGVVMGGTFLLEIGAYILAGALGMQLGLTFLPRGGDAPPLPERLRELRANVRLLLPVIALLLLLGAAWENTGLYLFGRFP